MKFHQVIALVIKDWQTARHHRIALVAEVTFPIVTGLLACFMLFDLDALVETFQNMSYLTYAGFSKNCFVQWIGFTEPFSAMLVFLLFELGGWPCNWPNGPYPTAEAGVRAWVAAANQSYVAAQNSLMLSGDPSTGLTVYTAPSFTAIPVMNVAEVLQRIYYPDVNVTLSGQLGNSIDQLTSNTYQVLGTLAAVMLCITYVPVASLVAGRLVDERRTGIRAHLLAMGVRSSSYVTATLIMSASRAHLATNCIAVIMVAWFKDALDMNDIAMIILILNAYGLSLCASALIAPAIFSKSQLAIAFMWIYVIVWAFIAPFVSVLPAGGAMMVTVLFAPTAAMFGLAPILGGHVVSLMFSPGEILMVLLFQVALYTVIAEYLFAISRSRGDVSKHACCFFHRCCPSTRTTSADMTAAAIVARDVCKSFGGQPAIDQVSLTLSQGEIVVLIGRLGSGKTTLLSVLSGSTRPTEYAECSIGGHDLLTDIDGVRECVSFCPQRDILFDDLSARQHLTMFARLAGKSAAARVSETNDLIERLGLPSGHEPASTYSEGTRRILCVACALIGNQRIIYLDEPSRGVDSVGQARLWALLREQRDTAARAFLVSTNSPVEAAALADRAGLLVQGKLVVFDDVQNLQRKSGLFLKIHKSTSDDFFDLRSVLALVQNFCAASRLVINIGSTVVIQLPHSDLDNVTALVRTIESRAQTMHIASFGLSYNALDDEMTLLQGPESCRSDASAAVSMGDGTEGLPQSHGGGAAFQHIAEEAAQLSLLNVLRAQVVTVFRMLSKQWLRSPRCLMLGFVIPLLFVAVAYADVIPNFMDNSGSGSNIPPLPLTELTRGPRLDQTIHVALYPSRQTLGSQAYDGLTPEVNEACSRQLMGQFAERYAAWTEAQTGRAQWLHFKYVSSRQMIEDNAYVDTHSISWSVLADLDIIIFISECPSVSANNSAFGWVWFYNMALDGQPLIALDLMMRNAALSFSRPNLTVPNVTFAHLPILTPDEMPPPTPTATPYTHPPQQYFVQPIVVFMILAAAQFASNAALVVADDINKKRYFAMRLQGLIPSAFWLGHYLYDGLMAMPLVLMFLVGPWVRGIYYMEQPCTISIDVFAFLLLLSFSLLAGYAAVIVLPRDSKHSTYISGAYFSHMVMLGLPWVILTLYIKASSDILTRDTLAWVNFLTPQMALMWIITSQPLDGCSWAISSHYGALASLLLWHAVPLTLLVRYSRRDIKTCPFHVVKTPLQPAETHRETEPLLSDERTTTPQHSDVSILNVDGEKDYAVGRLRQGECVFLLGSNGSGKTSALHLQLYQMLHDVQFNARRARLGVCLRADALWDEMTVEEHLELYIRLRLCTYCNDNQTDIIKEQITEALRSMDMDAALKQRVGNLSAGAKRQLAAAIALFTGGTIILLDEPSAGMDSYSRRALWHSVEHAVSRQGASVFFATQSVEDAEAMGNVRISIVKDGSIVLKAASANDIRLQSTGGHRILMGLEFSRSFPAATADELISAAFGGKCTKVSDTTGTQRTYVFSRGTQATASYVIHELLAQSSAWGVNGFTVQQRSPIEEILAELNPSRNI